MSVAPWQPGTTYAPGALCVPRSSAPATAVALLNPNFTDSSGWDLDAPLAIVTDTAGYGGNGRVGPTAVTASASAFNQAHIGVVPGQTVSASCMVQHGTGDQHASDASVFIRWYGASGFLSQTGGLSIQNPRTNAWQQISVSGTAPANTTYCQIGVNFRKNGADDIEASAFKLQYTPQAPARAAMYKATQAAPGKSGGAEPAWPPIGDSVQDNEVTWEGVNIDRLVWQASALLTSGDTEPTWPDAVGAAVRDGTIDWVAFVPYITDPKCPHSKVVAIMASKVFAADADIVRFSATANAADWSSEQDAGYLPTGLQQQSANDAAVLAPYRSNLVVMNASSFQNWQVDPDPAQMAMLDQMEGIGSSAQQAAQPVGNELFYLSQLGVRSVSIAAGSDNLKAGDIGMPIDPLVQASIAAIPAGDVPRAIYYPSSGQYWLACNTADGTATMWIFTMNGGKGKWSRYGLPFTVDAFAQLANVMYVRSGAQVFKVDESATTDGAAPGMPFAGVVQWPWLDLGNAGMTKMIAGFDIVASGAPAVSVGYNQSNPGYFTEPYAVGPDTLPGTMIAMPVAAPSFSFKVDFAAGTAWTLQSLQVYLDDTRGQP